MFTRSKGKMADTSRRNSVNSLSESEDPPQLSDVRLLTTANLGQAQNGEEHIHEYESDDNGLLSQEKSADVRCSPTHDDDNDADDESEFELGQRFSGNDDDDDSEIEFKNPLDSVQGNKVETQPNTSVEDMMKALLIQFRENKEERTKKDQRDEKQRAIDKAEQAKKERKAEEERARDKAERAERDRKDDEERARDREERAKEFQAVNDKLTSIDCRFRKELDHRMKKVREEFRSDFEEAKKERIRDAKERIRDVKDINKTTEYLSRELTAIKTSHNALASKCETMFKGISKDTPQPDGVHITPGERDIRSVQPTPATVGEGAGHITTPTSQLKITDRRRAFEHPCESDSDSHYEEDTRRKRPRFGPQECLHSDHSIERGEIIRRYPNKPPASHPPTEVHNSSSSASTDRNTADHSIVGTDRLIDVRIKLPAFTGSEKWNVWYGRFEDVAKARQWSQEERRVELMQRLHGDAGEFVYDQISSSIRSNYEKLVTELSNRFRTVETPKAFIGKFSRRTQKPNERVEVFASELKMLYDKAYPKRSAETRNEDLLRKFLDGLYDDDARLHVECNKDPDNIDDAVCDVVKYQETKSRSTKSYDDDQYDRRSKRSRRTTYKGNNSKGNNTKSQKSEDESKNTSNEEVIKTLELVMNRLDVIEGKKQANGQAATTMQRDDGNQRKRYQGGNYPRPPRRCFYCDRPGHFARECRQKQRDDWESSRRQNQDGRENSRPQNHDGRGNSRPQNHDGWGNSRPQNPESWENSRSPSQENNQRPLSPIAEQPVNYRGHTQDKLEEP